MIVYLSNPVSHDLIRLNYTFIDCPLVRHHYIRYNIATDSLPRLSISLSTENRFQQPDYTEINKIYVDHRQVCTVRLLYPIYVFSKITNNSTMVVHWLN